MKIVSIKESIGPSPKKGPHDRSTGTYEIVTVNLDHDKKIMFGIVYETNCCEEWGINIDDGPEDPVGVEFTRVEICDDFVGNGYLWI